MSGSLVAIQTGWTASSVSAVLLTLQAAGVVYLSSARVDGLAGTWAALEATGHRVALADMACELTDFGRSLLDRIEEEGNQEVG